MSSAGKVFFFAFFEICRLRKGPQDIPESRNLLSLCLCTYGLLSIGLGMFIETPGNAILAGMLEVALLMFITQVMLQIGGKTKRWTQTVTAISGTGIIISLFALPFYFMTDFNVTQEVAATSGQGLGLLFLAVLACWNIVVVAHIFRHAMEIHFIMAMILALSYIWLVFTLTSVLLSSNDFVSVELV